MELVPSDVVGCRHPNSSASVRFSTVWGSVIQAGWGRRMGRLAWPGSKAQKSSRTPRRLSLQIRRFLFSLAHQIITE